MQNARYDVMYQAIQAKRNGALNGSVISISGKLVSKEEIQMSALEEWKTLSREEKQQLITELIEQENLDIRIVSAVRNTCGVCNKDMPHSIVSQFDATGENAKLTEEDLPQLCCYECES